MNFYLNYYYIEYIQNIIHIFSVLKNFDPDAVVYICECELILDKISSVK